MTWSFAQYSSYNSTKESTFALNGTLRKRIDKWSVSEWGIEAPSRPSLSAVSTSTLTGTYNAKYTYARKERNTVVCESNASSESTSTQAVATQYLRVTFTEPTDDQVNCIRIYRTATAGTTYYYDQDWNWANFNYGVTHQWEIDDQYVSADGYLWTTENTTDDSDDCFTWEIYRNVYTVNDVQRRITSKGDNAHAYVDTDTADASLGTEVDDDHDRPPAGSYVVGPTFNGICMISYNNKLYYSKAKQPEYWPAAYNVDVSPPQYPGVCIVLYDKQPYYLTKNKIYYIYYDGTNWTPKSVAAKTGTQSQNSALAVEGFGIWHVGNDGIYACVPSTDSRFGADNKISIAFNPVFSGQTANGVPPASDLSTCWLAQYKDRVYFGYQSSGYSYPTNILVFYLTEKKAAYFTRGTEIRAVGIDYTNDRFIAGDSSGNVWHIEGDDIVGDNGTAIDWEIETKDFMPQTRSWFPRWAKYDIDASSAASCTSGIYLNDELKQSHTVTGSRNIKRRLVTTCNGARCSIRINGSGTVKIYAAELE